MPRLSIAATSCSSFKQLVSILLLFVLLIMSSEKGNACICNSIGENPATCDPLYSIYMEMNQAHWALHESVNTPVSLQFFNSKANSISFNVVPPDANTCNGMPPWMSFDYNNFKLYGTTPDRGGYYHIYIESHQTGSTCNGTPFNYPVATHDLILAVHESPKIVGSIHNSIQYDSVTGKYSSIDDITVTGYPLPKISYSSFSSTNQEWSNMVAGYFSNSPITVPNCSRTCDCREENISLKFQPSRIRTSGPFPLRITATNNDKDGHELTANYDYNLYILDSPIFYYPLSMQFEVGTQHSVFSINYGWPRPVPKLTGTLPKGLILIPDSLLDGTPRPPPSPYNDPETGVRSSITGTPESGSGGVYPVTISASNGIAPDYQQNFEIIVNEALEISSESALFMESTFDSFAVVARGFPRPSSFSYSGLLPSGLYFDPYSGMIYGAPDTGSTGKYPIIILISNGVGPDAIKELVISVTNETPPLRFTGTTTTYLAGLSDINAAISGMDSATLQLRTTTLYGGFTLEQPASLTFDGGYDSGFASNIGDGVTIIDGGVIVRSGKLIVNKVTVR